MTKATIMPALFSGLVVFVSAGNVDADPLSGTKDIYLLSEGDSRLSIGSIQFTQTVEASQYLLVLDDTIFADHFLSMRPFKCLEGDQKHWCHVPFPYQNRRQVRAGDLTDLEYDLLFLWKGATEYGINMWNGVYYQLEIDGDRIVGTLREMDMEVLSAPPDQGNLRPITVRDLHPADAASHWLPRLVIE